MLPRRMLLLVDRQKPTTTALEKSSAPVKEWETPPWYLLGSPTSIPGMKSRSGAQQAVTMTVQKRAGRGSLERSRRPVQDRASSRCPTGLAIAPIPLKDTGR